LCKVFHFSECNPYPIFRNLDLSLKKAHQTPSKKICFQFYTPQQVSTILSRIVSFDSQDPSMDEKKKLGSVFDFACGSGSLILNVRKQMKEEDGVSKIFAQEKNITTYNLARMNMLLHGVKDNEFNISHGGKDGRDLLRCIKLSCFLAPACSKLSD
jgi:type I restriction-modification system DNA methylase subunit